MNSPFGWTAAGNLNSGTSFTPLSSHAAGGTVTGRHAMSEPHREVGKERESPTDHRPDTLERDILRTRVLGVLKQVRSLSRSPFTVLSVASRAYQSLKHGKGWHDQDCRDHRHRWRRHPQGFPRRRPYSTRWVGCSGPSGFRLAPTALASSKDGFAVTASSASSASKGPAHGVQISAGFSSVNMSTSGR